MKFRTEIMKALIGGYNAHILNMDLIDYNEKGDAVNLF